MSCPYCGAHTYFDQESPCASIELWECGTRYDSVIGDGYMQSRECERRVKEEEEEEQESMDLDNEAREAYGERYSAAPKTVEEVQTQRTRGIGEIILMVMATICGIGSILSVLYLMVWMLMNCGGK